MTRSTLSTTLGAAMLALSVAACSSESTAPVVANTTQVQLGAQTAAQLFSGTPTTARAGETVTITLNLLSATDVMGRCVNLELAQVSANLVRLQAVQSGGTYTLCSTAAVAPGPTVVRVPRSFATPGVYTVEVKGVDTAGAPISLAWSITVS